MTADALAAYALAEALASLWVLVVVACALWWGVEQAGKDGWL